MRRVGQRGLKFIVVCSLSIAATWGAVPVTAAPGADVAVAAEQVVAVFNFAQRDDDPQCAWLSKGLADLLINQLSDLPNVSVVSRDRMQTLVSGCERAAERARARFKLADDAPRLAARLDSGRMVFGTYRVADGRIHLAAQVTDPASEALVLSTEVEGPYEKVLDLQRELARRLRAHFTGQRVEDVGLDTVPQWTTQLGAAENLYVGVDLFDKGEFADAWLRFRQAGRADPSYVEAQYWEARMLYYLTQYGNALPVYERFLARAPSHPRAGDAVLEWVDSARQVIDEPQQLLDLYCRARRFADDDVLVYNKTVGFNMPLNWYLDSLQVKAEMALGLTQEACNHAVSLRHRIRASKGPYSGKVSQGSDVFRLWRAWDELGVSAATLHYRQKDRVAFSEKMFVGTYGQMNVDLRRLTGRCDGFAFPDGYGFQPRAIRQGDHYIARGEGTSRRFILAPDGYQMVNIRVTLEPYHKEGNLPAILHFICGCVSCDEYGTYQVRSDGGKQTLVLDPIHRCRFFGYRCWVNPADFSARAADLADIDALRGVDVTFDLEPLSKGEGTLRVLLENPNIAIRVRVDGQLLAQSLETVHGLTPGKHRVSIQPVTVSGRESILTDTTIDVDVASEGVTECCVSADIKPQANPCHWAKTRLLAFDFPEYRLPPGSQMCQWNAPSMVRLIRGPLAGRLLAVWDHGEQLWMSYSSDEGTTWRNPTELPVPVNTAHVETSPRVIQAEDGRVCLVFLSDRNLLRAHYPYITWSRDLASWSAPRLVEEIAADDLRLFQDQGGRFVMTVPPSWRNTDVEWLIFGDGEIRPSGWEEAVGKSLNRKRIVTLTSRDLVTWTRLETGLGGDTVRRADVGQYSDGRYYAVTTEVVDGRPGVELWRVAYQTSDDLVRWSEPVTVLKQSLSTLNNITAAAVGDRLIGAVAAGPERVRYFEIDKGTPPREFDYTLLIAQRNTLYHDPLTQQVHWISVNEDTSRLYYTVRSLDDKHVQSSDD